MKLACKDINSTTSCTFVATGATADEVAQTMLAHARAEHADDIENMSDEKVKTWFASEAHQ